ncbi:hypothetical protein CDAR_510111 [Caerostris darwini]|uniref:Uncharacterized protein n=1 Tax=Caerostris darwini TaxID=1538125 RepID=A0AAV4X5B8_9ARAC|nr:hypothetical protein CDAR_510111 [Caerostris darwini]
MVGAKNPWNTSKETLADIGQAFRQGATNFFRTQRNLRLDLWLTAISVSSFRKHSSEDKINTCLLEVTILPSGEDGATRTSSGATTLLTDHPLCAYLPLPPLPTK